MEVMEVGWTGGALVRSQSRLFPLCCPGRLRQAVRSCRSCGTGRSSRWRAVSATGLGRLVLELLCLAGGEWHRRGWRRASDEAEKRWA